MCVSKKLKQWSRRLTFERFHPTVFPFLSGISPTSVGFLKAVPIGPARSIVIAAKSEFPDLLIVWATMSQDSNVNPKLPTWNGHWYQWTSYKLQVELESDGTSKEHMEKPGPHLVRNLTSKAWDSCLDIDRSKLRIADGVTYMLEFLEAKRRKLKVDMIGDALSSYFKRSEVSRRDGETWADYELRYENYIRNISKALTELKASPVPWEIFGWFLLHHYVGLEPSD